MWTLFTTSPALKALKSMIHSIPVNFISTLLYKKYRAALLFPNELFAESHCPPSHPFAISDGAKCCKLAMEAQSSSAGCNSRYTSIESTCCFRDKDKVDCPMKPCINHPGLLFLCKATKEWTICHITFFSPKICSPEAWSSVDEPSKLSIRVW